MDDSKQDLIDLNEADVTSGLQQETAENVEGNEKAQGDDDVSAKRSDCTKWKVVSGELCMVKEEPSGNSYTSVVLNLLVCYHFT